MSGIVALLGDTLLKSGSDDTLNTADLVKQDLVIGLYFSAHYCPPCREFTPKLVEFYKKFTAANPGKLEIIFMSHDVNEDEFKSYFGEMPWLALPWLGLPCDESKAVKVSDNYGVPYIPTLVMVKADTGEAITKNGQKKVEKDPEGKKFPWPCPSLAELLNGPLLSKSGQVDASSALDGKTRGWYFAAQEDEDCKEFTPKLAECYKNLKENDKNFEIIFISLDEDEREFEEHFKEMPWLAISKEEDDRIDGLNEKFEVYGTPRLVILDENNEVVNRDACEAVKRDLEGKDFPWFPKHFVQLMEEDAPMLTEITSLIILTDGSKEEAQKAIEILEPISRSYAEEMQSDEIPSLSFYYVGPKTGNYVQSLKEFTGFTDLEAPAVIILGEEYNFESDDDDDETVLFKYKRDSASKEDIQEIVNLYKTGKLEKMSFRE